MPRSDEQRYEMMSRDNPERSLLLEELGKRLRRIRRRQHLTQADVARRAGVERRLIQYIETGIADADTWVWEKIAWGLGMRGFSELLSER